MGGQVDGDAAGSPYDEVLASYVFQDDVKVVGFELQAVPIIADVEMNADGCVHGTVMLSRQARRGLPGTMGQVSVHAIWTATIALGGQVWESLVFMFPGDTGWEIDEGESVNMLAWFETTCATPVKWYGDAVIYYVER